MMLGSNASDIDQVREIQSLRSHCSTDRDRPSVVTSADTYINNAPVPGGLYDPRMESHAKMLRRATMTTVPAPGHPDIELAVRCNNAIYVDMVRKPLRCICINCSHSLIDDDSIIQAQGQPGDSTWPRRNVSR
jgi:DNA-directed RNA polymerase II subunit RPB1